MQRYLLFDAGCAVCSQMAEELDEVSNGWFTARSLRDEEMQTLLKRAKPNWKWEPTLLEVKGATVRAYTGLNMRVRVAAGVGPGRAWQMAKIVYGYQLTSGGDPLAVYKGRAFTSARRTFLKQISMAAGTLVLPVSANSASRMGGLRSNASLWERLSPIEAASVVTATRSSAPYQGLPQASHHSSPLVRGRVSSATMM